MEDLLLKYLPHMDFYRTKFQQFFYYPYIMQANLPLFRSELVNTDSLGFRFTKKPQNGWMSFDDPEIIECENLFMGGSTAMGWGSKYGDRGTIPSYLAELGGEKWLNMSVCAQSIQNNFINFCFLSGRLKKLKRVVFLGGYNELAIFMNGNFFSKTYGGIYGQTEFHKSMNKHLEELKRSHEGLRGDFMELPENSMEKVEIFKEWLQHTLETVIQTILAKNMSFTFLIQPYYDWIDRGLTQKEVLITQWCSENHARACKKNYYEEIKNSKPWYFQLLKDACAVKNVPCIDLNMELAQSRYQDLWVFYDPAHLSDEANQAIAKQILEKC